MHVESLCHGYDLGADIQSGFGKDWKTHSSETFHKQFMEEKEINKPK